MKIKLLIPLLAILLLTGFGCNTQNQTAGDTISNIQDALESNQKIKCTYSDQNFETVTYIQGETYRTEYELDGDTYVSVFDGEKITTWNETTREGNTFAISCLGEEIGKGDRGDFDAPTSDSDQLDDYYASQETGYETAEDLLEDQMNLECRNVSSIDFSIPDDLDLYDQCEDLQLILDYNSADDDDDDDEDSGDDEYSGMGDDMDTKVTP